MPHVLAKLKNAKIDMVAQMLKDHAAQHAKDGFYAKHLWQNADDANEIFFLFKCDDLKIARQVIDRVHGEALKQDPKANLPHMTFLEEKEFKANGPKFPAEASIEINASDSKVWEALTDPKLIKQYLFGTETKTDWKVGSQITYEGEWEGKKYQDKGKILKFEPKKLLVTSYWSSMSGSEDKPENYKMVSYKLSSGNGKTKLTILQENNKSQQESDHSKKNWEMVLAKMKEIVENNK